MTTPFEYLMNGSLIRAGYETFNQPFGITGVDNLPIGILFLVFQALLYIKVRNIGFHFIVSLILFASMFVFIPNIIKGVIVVILVLELTGILYLWFVKET